MSFCRRRCSPNGVRHPPAAWALGTFPEASGRVHTGLVGWRVGVIRAEPVHRRHQRALGEESSTLNQEAVGQGVGPAQVSGRQGSGTSLFAQSRRPRTSLPQAQPEPWTNHVVISSYTNTHTQTQSHPRAWKRPAHTRRQPRPQTTCSSSSETRASHPPKLPTTEGPVSPTERVVSLCPCAGLGRRPPGALPEGRRRQNGGGTAVYAGPRCCGKEPRLQAQVPFEGSSVPSGECPSAPEGKALSGHSQDSRLAPCWDRELAPRSTGQGRRHRGLGEGAPGRRY